MENYNKQLDERFEEWEKESEIKNFFSDGLMFRGKMNEEKTWRYPGNENKQWDEAPKRVMFLMKDVNAGEDDLGDDDDVRGRIFKDTSVRIYRNMSYWLYGLLKTTENGQIPDFTFSVSEATQFFDDTPVAYVNCKKEAGTSSVAHNTLVNHIKRDKKFLIEEIKILDPDIIVCCAWTESAGNPILKFIKESVYQDIKEINNWMYYSEKENKLIIDSYHPTTPKSKNKEMYHNMMKAYKEFLDKYPDFKNSCR